MAQGGLHSVNENESYKSSLTHTLEDIDVSSMYPAFIVNNNIRPYHIKKEFGELFKEFYEKRLSLKPLAKRDKKIKGIVDAYKLLLNGCYGKFGSKDSWLYDPQAMLSVTIGCQLCLIMLIEDLELNGIKIVSANTDGLLLYYPNELTSLKEEITKKWEKITGFLLENVLMKEIYFLSVNDYLAITKSGDVKLKGDFLIDLEFHKNKSFRIIPIALREYFVNNNQNIEEFIKNHNNLMDFCARANVNSTYYLEYIEKNNTLLYNKIVRYYISNNGGKLQKVKKADCTTNAAPRAEINAGYNSIIINSIPKNEKIHFDNINYDFYIDKVNELINRIKLGKKPKKVIKKVKEQLTLNF